MQLDTINIRPILAADNEWLAFIIRRALTEFNAAKPGTVYYDPTTDHLSSVFEAPGSKYFIAEHDGILLGGAGIFPTKGLPADTCELVKLYLSSDARGIGLGKKLMEVCEAAAKELGYKNIYLETMPELSIAVPLYQKTGFTRLPAPMGDTGHGGCNIWMLKKIGQDSATNFTS